MATTEIRKLSETIYQGTMREIKFRAKSLDGLWEYGDLHLRCKHPHIHNLIGAKIYIDPNTVGQFTGLHDKNGKEIYEGDIICSPRGNKHYIIYDDNNGSYAAVKIGNEPEDGMCSTTKYWIEHYEKEVIGNIHDNPELLNGR